MLRREIQRNRKLLRKQQRAAQRKSILSKAVLTGAATTFILSGTVAPAMASPSEAPSEDQGTQQNSTSDYQPLESVSLTSSVSDESDAEDADEDERREEDTEDTEGDDEQEEREYESYILVVSGDLVDTITVRNEGERVYTALTDRGVSTSSLRNDEGERVTAEDLRERSLNNGETVVLTTSERDISTEEVELPFRTEEVETDELVVGDEVIEQEGIDGSGVNITTTYRNGDAESTESRLTITEAPQREIILVGTADPIDLADEVSYEPGEEFVPLEDLSNSIYSPDSDTYSEESAERFARSANTDDAPSYVGGDSDEVRYDIVNEMLGQVGNRYTWGGTTPGGGFDCSGIIQWAAAQHGVSIPRVAIDQGRAGTPVSWENIQVGDLIYTSAHIGVYAGDGKIVHAANPRVGVVVDNASHYRNSGFKVSRIF